MRRGVGVAAPDAARHADDVAVELRRAVGRVGRARQLGARWGGALRRGREGESGRGLLGSALAGVVVGGREDHRCGGEEGEEEGGLHVSLVL